MQTLWQDVRFALRTLLKQRGFTLVAIITLALGIGANSAIFTVVNAVLLRPLAYSQPDKLVKVYETFLPSGWGSVSAANYQDWRAQNTVFSQLAAYSIGGGFNLQAADNPQRLNGISCTANLFEILGVQPQLGRAFLAEENEPGKNRVVMLSDTLWRTNFGADPNLIGREIQLNGVNHRVVGVLPRGFAFPSRRTEIWAPLALDEKAWANRGSHQYQVMGRLKPDTSLAQAHEQMASIAANIERQYPKEQTGRSVRLTQYQEEVVQNVRPALLTLFAAVGCVLLIACANVANLLLARATGRRKEIAIRMALGASRWRLLRQLLTESVLLAVAGGVLGLLLAKWGVTALVALAAGLLPRAQEVALDASVVGFTFALAVLTGLFFGLIPAWQSSKGDVQWALKESGNSGSSPRNWLRSVFVITEVAVALMLLIGAGLLIRSFARLQETETGLRTEHVLTASLNLPQAKYDKPETVSDFYQRLLENLAAQPGIEAAGAINLLPIAQYGNNGNYLIEGENITEINRGPIAEVRIVTTGYFDAFGIPLLAGRSLNQQDQLNSPQVALVNQTWAKRHAANPQDVIGKRFGFGDTQRWTVVGVVGDVKQSGLTQSTRAEIYYPHAQAPNSSLNLIVRSTADPTTLTTTLRREVFKLDPAQPLANVRTMETVVVESIADRRFNMLLLGLFAGLALVLAALGIYGVLSYTVAQSTRELGIRMALGAQARDVLRLVIGQGLLLTLAGIVLGLGGAFALTRWLESLLFGVKATDPLTFAAVPTVLLAIALLSCLVPARRATKVDPLVALRSE